MKHYDQTTKYHDQTMYEHTTYYYNQTMNCHDHIMDYHDQAINYNDQNIINYYQTMNFHDYTMNSHDLLWTIANICSSFWDIIVHRGCPAFTNLPREGGGGVPIICQILGTKKDHRTHRRVKKYVGGLRFTAHLGGCPDFTNEKKKFPVMFSELFLSLRDL